MSSHSIPDHVDKIHKEFVESLYKKHYMVAEKTKARDKYGTPIEARIYFWTRYSILECLRGRQDDAHLSLAVDLYDVRMQIADIEEFHMRTIDTETKEVTIVYRAQMEWRALQKRKMDIQREMERVGGGGSKPSGGAR